MAALVIENQTEALTHIQSQFSNALNLTPAIADDRVDLGVWLASLESFFASGTSLSPGGEESTSDTTKEFQLTQAALIRCAGLTSILLLDGQDGSDLDTHELADLAGMLRDSILIGDCLVESGRLGPAEWKAWTSTLAQRLAHCPAYPKLIEIAVEAGKRNLPLTLLSIAADPVDEEHAELALILPRFGKVLRWLDVVGRMLKADEPLKPAIIILACVSEQVSSLIDTINARLGRFENEDSQIFGALDSAAYTASIEMKKVYLKELNGVAQLRPSPSVYARMETSHSLLSEGFQQILAGFAKTVDPDSDPLTLFPNFKQKLDESIKLRRDLHGLAALVQVAEKDPTKGQVEAMRAATRQFMDHSLRLLFYKDSETVERFVEELMMAKENKELVPILHRFGAYLDTLFGQVSLRTVLANHPFES